MVWKGGDGRRVVMVAPTTSQPRFHRRADAFLRAGWEVTVYAFQRGFYEENVFPEAVEVVRLGRIQNRHYGERAFRLLLARDAICRHERRRTSAAALYGFGYDCFLLSGSCGARAGSVRCLEIGDLRVPGMRAGPARLIAKSAERALCARADLIVVTSAGFVEGYLERVLPGIGGRTVVAENKLPYKLFGALSRDERTRSRGEVLRIGFAGLMRYEKSLRVVLELAARRPKDVVFECFGDGPLRGLVLEYAGQWGNIHYRGPFRNPEDLEGVYGEMDVNYVVYDASDINVRLAIPNKYYESLFFGVPIICACGTAFAGRVGELGVGVCVEPGDVGELERSLESLTDEALAGARARALAVPRAELLDDGVNVVRRIEEVLAARGSFE